MAILLGLWTPWFIVNWMAVEAQLLVSEQLSSTNDTCNLSTEFYDQAALGCSQCVVANGASTISNSWLVPDNSSRFSGLATACTCNQDAVWEARNDSMCELIWPVPCSLDACAACSSDQVLSRDSSRCMACGTSTVGIQESVRECKCGANSILREKSENGSFLDKKECVVCSNNTVADSSTNTCKACPDPVMTVDGDSYVCTCPSDYQLVTSTFMSVQKCIAKAHIDLISSKIPLSDAKEMIFSSFSKEETVASDSTVSITSAVLADMFLPAITGCYFYQSERDLVSCQALGNLCVLQHFLLESPSCAVFDLIQRSGRSATVNGINGWFTTLPFLSYRSVASSVTRSPVPMKMSWDATSNEGSFDHLEFVLASYHVNGSLIGFQSLVNELLYCKRENGLGAVELLSWVRFGVNALSEYSCDLEALQTAALSLYELFLVDQTKSSGEDGRFVPIPVKNLNYRDSSGAFVNQDSDITNDFLSHRFFLYDFQTGISAGGTSPKVIRYADRITLTVRTQDSNPNSIYVPELTVAYTDTQNSRSVPVVFRVTYTSDTDAFWSAAKALFTVGCVLAGCQVLLQMFNWYRRSIRNEIVENAMCQILPVMISYGASIFAPVSFCVMFVMFSYLFMIFRLQSSDVLMLPEVNYDPLARNDEYYPFRVLLPLSFFCQLATVFHQVYRQAQLQLFFIDWEKPRASIVDIDSAQPTHAPISVWRLILVVNEWNKLQTVRKTSLRFTLVFLLFLLYGCNVRMLSLPIPRAQMKYVSFTTTASSSDAVDHQLNPYLRFANVSFWWLIIYVGQRLWKWMIFERYIDEPREQLFIDLCTVSKVSCLFLDETYHGFYLHCRSPHPFADGSMGELVDQLKQEEAGLTAGRYLDSTFPHCQTFEMFVTRKWKRKFQTLYLSVRGDSSVNGRAASEGLIQRSFSPKVPHNLPVKSTNLKRQNGMVATEAMVRSAEQLRGFLQAFVENQDDRFRWRIYRAHTCITRFLDIPPDMSFSKQSLFLPDTESKFVKASLLLGIENELMLLDLLCFCLLDLWVGNHAISALATYALQIVLLSARAHVGRRNIARSTLVDSRFLI